ncbi:MAG: hypothetical protein K2L89_06335 [Muribaculaceae bacterium]|nr:hypothetical protein [Muribaculaceae bacterium]
MSIFKCNTGVSTPVGTYPGVSDFYYPSRADFSGNVPTIPNYFGRFGKRPYYAG